MLHLFGFYNSTRVRGLRSKAKEKRYTHQFSGEDVYTKMYNAWFNDINGAPWVKQKDALIGINLTRWKGRLVWYS